MTPAPFTRTSRHLSGKVARAARRLPPSAAYPPCAAQLPRLASVLAGAFCRGKA